MSAAVVLLCLLSGQTAVGQDALLQRSRDEYRAGRYADAAKDALAAADAILTPETMQTFVNTGQFDSLAKFETAIVYLTLADVKLGREDDAREQLQRLRVAEGIAPTFATLALDSVVAEFPQIAGRLLPSLQLPSNASLASAAPQGVPVPVSAALPAPSQQAVQAVSEAEQRYIDQKIAEARVEIEQRAQEQIAAIRTEAQQQIAQARAEAKEAQQKAAAAQTPAAPVKIEATSTIVAALHKAAVQANTGDVADAVATYRQLADAAGAQRDVVAAAAVGLYRTGDFSDALAALQRLGTLARGEEDLRYYRAVALFETGHYDEAKKDLDCALPYIEMTDDVARYRVKIDQMQALSGSGHKSS